MLRILWILLLLPVVELLLTGFLYSRFGTPFLGWLALGAVAGALLISRAKAGLRAALAPLQSGNAQVVNGSLWRVLASARSFFAGVLLLFPGILTDVLALVVLLLPARWMSRAAGVGPKAANDDVIEAEYHEVREMREVLEVRPPREVPDDKQGPPRA